MPTIEEVLGVINSTGYFSDKPSKAYTRQYLKREKEREKQRNQAIDQRLSQGQSWEKIAADTGVSLQEVQDYSQKTRPNYGVQKGLVQQAQEVGSTISGAFNNVRRDLTGVNTAVEKTNELQNRVWNNQKKLIMQNGVLTPEAKKKALDKLAEKQRAYNKQQGEAIQNDIQTLQNAQDNSIVRGGAAFGAGVERSATGLVQGASGLVDLATPGEGTSRVTQTANRLAEKTDQLVKDNQFNTPLYKGGQFTGEALQWLTGAKVIKGLSNAPKLAKLVAVADKADELEKVLMNVNKGGKVGEAAIKTARYLVDPARVANVIQNTAVDQGQLSARGEDISAGSVAQSVGLNYALGGVLDAAGAGLARRAQNKATKLAESPTPSAKQQQAAEEVLAQSRRSQGLDVEQPTVTQSVGAAPQGDLPDLTTSTTGNYGASVPQAAQRLEADAIQAKVISSGELDLPSTANINMEDQANKAIVLMDDNWSNAVDVAMGNTNAPGNLQSSVVYEAVKRRAIENGDKTLIYQLGKSSVPSQGKAAGQFIKGFDTKDPTDPVEAIRQVLKAKEESKIAGINKDLTPEELGRITDLSDNVRRTQAAIPEGSPDFSPERVAYGEALVAMRRYKNELIDGTKTGYQKFAPRGFLTATAGTAKSLKAALDNSFFGRQGLKVLTSHPTVWGKAFLKSWGDIAKGVKGIDALDALDAMNLSRANAMNGRYGKMGLDLHTVEEAFPSSLPEKMPVLGRLFKASEYAYTGAAHRMRADLADMMLEKAQKGGVDIDNPEQLQKIGKLINSMTGRGHLGKAEQGADILNNLFFSPRNWKSNIDFLTAHQFQKGTSIRNRDAAAKYVRKEAGKNLAKMIATVGAVAATANALAPGSFEKDPRSSNFGKIKIGNTRFDITGGNASIATLVSRLLPDPKKLSQGDLKWYTKSSTTGFVNELNSDAYGSRSVWDVLMDYGEGKFSPSTAAVKQLLTQENFIGEPVTPQSFLKDLFVPLPYTNYQELKKDPKSANALVATLADALGVGTNTYDGQKDWNRSSSASIKEFKKNVSGNAFTEANKEYNTEFNQWLNTIKDDPELRNYTEQERNSLINTKARRLTEDIMNRYGFDYQRKTKTSEQKRTSDRLLNL